MIDKRENIIEAKQMLVDSQPMASKRSSEVLLMQQGTKGAKRKLFNDIKRMKKHDKFIRSLVWSEVWKF